MSRKVSPRFYLRNPDQEFTSIYLRYNYTVSGTKRRFLYAIGESVMSDHWDSDEMRLKTNVKPRRVSDDNRSVNKLIDEHAEALIAVVDELNSKRRPIKNLRELLDVELGKVVKKHGTFIDHFETIINNRRNGIELTTKGTRFSHNVLLSYGTTLNWIKKYESHYRLKLFPEDINMEFYHKFVGFMNDQDKAVNSIGGRVKHIKMIMRMLFSKGITNNRIFENKDFRKLEEETDSIYLNENELDVLCDMKLDGRLERVRDLFLIGCYTGLRFSDFSYLTKDNIIEGRILKVIPQKTDDVVYIPIHRRVAIIMSKYNGAPEAISNQKLNQYLKELCRKAGIDGREEFKITKGGERRSESFEKWEKVSSHTARRSFATNLYLAGVDTLSIMRITGHKTQESFLKYIRVSKEQNALRMLKHDFFK